MSETTIGDLAAAIFERPEWWDRAACRGLDTAMFYPTRGEGVNNLKRLCFQCDAKQECLLDALDRYDKNGIFGGRSERERRRMRRLRRQAAARGEVYEPQAIDYLPPPDPVRRPRRRPAARFNGLELVTVKRSKKTSAARSARRRPGRRWTESGWQEAA